MKINNKYIYLLIKHIFNLQTHILQNDDKFDKFIAKRKDNP